MSADQAAILESIRDIIAGNPLEVGAAGSNPADEEIMDLTQMVNADGSITEIKPKAKKKAEAKKEEKTASLEAMPEKPVERALAALKPELKSSSSDILSELDALLNESAAEQPIPELAPKAKEGLKTEPKVEPAPAPKKDGMTIELAEIDKKQQELEKLIKPEPSVVIPAEPKIELKIEAPAPVPVEEFSPINLKEEVKTMTEEVVSESSISAAKSSIASLMSKLDETKKSSPAFKSGETVEGIVAEMLKPMMKDWLDNNLPKLVNHIVEREIAKIMSNK